jgi:hypothetical protein
MGRQGIHRLHDNPNASDLGQNRSTEEGQKMSTTTAFAKAFRPKYRIASPQQWSKIKLLKDASPWVPACVGKITQLSQLSQNWDGYGSDPVSKDALRTALRFLEEGPIQIIPEPSVSPVPGGGLGFHWQVEGRDLELEFLPDGAVEYLKTNRAVGEEIKPQEGALPDLADAKLWRWLAGEFA